MAINLVQKLAQRDGISALPKIDPNTQDISADAKVFADKLSQAAIPAVLVGLYKYTRDEHRAGDILKSSFKSNWRQEVFGDRFDKLVAGIAAYSGETAAQVSSKLDNVLDNSIEVIKQETGDVNGNTVKEIFTAARTGILSHLPAAIGVGEFLDDNSFDDRTNKMEGPVSSLMHKIEKTFAGTEGTEGEPRM